MQFELKEIGRLSWAVNISFQTFGNCESSLLAATSLLLQWINHVNGLHWANWNYYDYNYGEQQCTYVGQLPWLTQHDTELQNIITKKQILHYLPSHIPSALQLLQSRNMQDWQYPHHPFCSCNVKSKVDGGGLICHPLFLFSTFDLNRQGKYD